MVSHFFLQLSSQNSHQVYHSFLPPSSCFLHIPPFSPILQIDPQFSTISLEDSVCNESWYNFYRKNLKVLSDAFDAKQISFQDREPNFHQNHISNLPPAHIFSTAQ